MAKQFLKLESVSKGDTARSISSGVVGFGLGVAQKMVQEKGTSVGGINLGTAMPAIEIVGGLALQFQKNSMLRAVGQAGILVGSYEAGKQGVSAIIDGAKPTGSVSARRHSARSVPRGVPSTRSYGSNLHSLYG